jgi:EXS family
VVINSLYSFWWDVVVDWDLSILTNPSEPGPSLWGLRKSIHFTSPTVYYLAIALDLLLR